MMLKLGLPKGSLQEATFSLFARAGFDLKVSSRSYQPVIDDEEIEPILLRPQEIPLYLKQGLIDAGLTGHDWIVNYGAEKSLVELAELRYSKMTARPIRVVLAVAQGGEIRRPEDLAGRKVATEYVELARRWFAERDIPVDVEFSWGACEVKVPQLVPAIVVNTETGNSLRAHNLVEIETLLTSTTRFVCRPEALDDPEKLRKLDALKTLLEGAMNASRLVGLKMNVPPERREAVLAELPSLQRPTISPLDDQGWVAAEVILESRVSRDLIPRLKAAGATGLVEYPLNKVVL